MSLLVPKKLKKWSKVAVVSSSWGWPWTFSHRYEAWVKQLQDVFWVEIIAMPHALKTADWLYDNPEARAQDLMTAFADSQIEWIISSIWWDDSIRMLPYINFNIIRDNPKVFLWFSDTTISHFICYKAWLRSYYWPSIMAWFAENWWMMSYMTQSLQKTIFQNDIIWDLIVNSDGWTDEYLDWSNPNNQTIKRKLSSPTPWRFIQWSWTTEGALLGWCIDTFYFMWGTSIRPAKEEWKWKILFIETSEEEMSNDNFERILRTMWVQGILQNLNGIIVAKAYKDKSYDESLLKIVNREFWLNHLTIVSNVEFWHTTPMLTLPIWARMLLDTEAKNISIVESWVK